MGRKGGSPEFVKMIMLKKKKISKPRLENGVEVEIRDEKTVKSEKESGLQKGSVDKEVRKGGKKSNSQKTNRDKEVGKSEKKPNSHKPGVNKEVEKSGKKPSLDKEEVKGKKPNPQEFIFGKKKIGKWKYGSKWDKPTKKPHFDLEGKRAQEKAWAKMLKPREIPHKNVKPWFNPEPPYKPVRMKRRNPKRIESIHLEIDMRSNVKRGRVTAAMYKRWDAARRKPIVSLEVPNGSNDQVELERVQSDKEKDRTKRTNRIQTMERRIVEIKYTELEWTEVRQEKEKRMEEIDAEKIEVLKKYQGVFERRKKKRKNEKK